jgi:AcrR family transcriptional regulator
MVGNVPRSTVPAGPGRRRRSDAPRERQLPSGRHGLTRGFVAANQRGRIVEALVEVVDRFGLPAASVERVAARAGVSRRTFYEQFDGRDDLFAHTLDLAARGLHARVEAALAGEGDDAARLRRGLGALLDGLAEQPRLARLCVVTVLSAGPDALARRDAWMARFAELLDGLARERGEALPPLTAEGLVGAVYDVVYKRIAAGETASLPRLLDHLHGFCLLLLGGASDPRG